MTRIKKTTKQCIDEILKKFPENRIKFGYDRFDYQGAHTKTWIWCNRCKKYFEQTPNSHLKGSGCNKCKYIDYANKTCKTLEQFIIEAILVHGDLYGYDRVVYINNNTEVSIYCKKCNKYFPQTPINHLSGCGCKKCGYINVTEKMTMTLEDFIKRSICIHGNKYGYDKVVIINGHIVVSIYCNSCKKYFPQRPDKHLQNHGCSICRESKGEKEISKYLDEHDIKYISQKRYSDCKDINTLPFDFYLSKYNILIEYQGEQHYMLVNFSGHMSKEKQEENLEYVQYHDQIKRDYSTANNITLIEIPYWDFKNIETIISNLINTNIRGKHVIR